MVVTTGLSLILLFEQVELGRPCFAHREGLLPRVRCHRAPVASRQLRLPRR